MLLRTLQITYRLGPRLSPYPLSPYWLKGVQSPLLKFSKKVEGGAFFNTGCSYFLDNLDTGVLRVVFILDNSSAWHF